MTHRQNSNLINAKKIFQEKHYITYGLSITLSKNLSLKPI
jgi:hypothetical protein